MRLGRMVHGGLCLAHDDMGATMLVEGGIPGEEVEIAVRYRKGSTSFAEVVRVIEAVATPSHAALPVRAQMRRLSAPARGVRASGRAQTGHRARRPAPAAHRAPRAARCTPSTIPGGIDCVGSSTSSPGRKARLPHSGSTEHAAGGRSRSTTASSIIRGSPPRCRRLRALARRSSATNATRHPAPHGRRGRAGTALVHAKPARGLASGGARRRARPARRRARQHVLDDAALARDDVSRDGRTRSSR